jgi:hypothetical protein
MSAQLSQDRVGNVVAVADNLLHQQREMLMPVQPTAPETCLTESEGSGGRVGYPQPRFDADRRLVGPGNDNQTVIVQFGDRYRFRRDDDLQWVFQIRRGREWKSVRFCTTAAGVDRVLCEYIGLSNDWLTGRVTGGLDRFRVGSVRREVH